jgi:hypothetical protein
MGAEIATRLSREFSARDQFGNRPIIAAPGERELLMTQVQTPASVKRTMAPATSRTERATSGDRHSPSSKFAPAMENRTPRAARP